MIPLILQAFGLVLCYNTTNMSTVILDYPNSQQTSIVSQETKSAINDLHIPIYWLSVTDYWLYLCAIPQNDSQGN